MSQKYFRLRGMPSRPGGPRTLITFLYKIDLVFWGKDYFKQKITLKNHAQEKIEKKTCIWVGSTRRRPNKSKNMGHSFTRFWFYFFEFAKVFWYSVSVSQIFCHFHLSVLHKNWNFSKFINSNDWNVGKQTNCVEKIFINLKTDTNNVKKK